MVKRTMKHSIAFIKNSLIFNSLNKYLSYFLQRYTSIDQTPLKDNHKDVKTLPNPLHRLPPKVCQFMATPTTPKTPTDPLLQRIALKTNDKSKTMKTRGILQNTLYADTSKASCAKVCTSKQPFSPEQSRGVFYSFSDVSSLFTPANANNCDEEESENSNSRCHWTKGSYRLHQNPSYLSSDDQSSITLSPTGMVCF